MLVIDPGNPSLLGGAAYSEPVHMCTFRPLLIRIGVEVPHISEPAMPGSERPSRPKLIFNVGVSQN